MQFGIMNLIILKASVICNLVEFVSSSPTRKSSNIPWNGWHQVCCKMLSLWTPFHQQLAWWQFPPCVSLEPYALFPNENIKIID